MRRFLCAIQYAPDRITVVSILICGHAEKDMRQTRATTPTISPRHRWHDIFISTMFTDICYRGDGRMVVGGTHTRRRWVGYH